MKILSVNAGSSSLKFQLYEMPEEKVLISGLMERIGIGNSFYTIKVNGEKIKKEVELNNHEEAFETLVKELEANQVKVINTDPETIKDIDSIVKYIKKSFDTTSEDIAKTFSLGTLDGQKIINVDLLKSELMNTLSITEE